MAVLAKQYVHQGTLENVILELFPNENITKNARKETGLLNPLTGSFLELDAWLPDLNVCYEFQDPHHYASATWDSFHSIQEIKKRDDLKKEMVLKSGEDLVLVPCWWDGEAASLAAATHFQRPDLLQDSDEDYLIPLNPPLNFFSDESIPVIQEMMLASFPVVTHNFSNLFEEGFWWMGEKYDGVRFCWIPVAKSVYTRSGNVIRLPTTFKSLFGNSLLDGEMWFGRRYFQESQLLVRTVDINWAQLRAVVFDVPTQWGRKGLSFEKRYAKIFEYISAEHPFIISAIRMKCEDNKKLMKVSKLIIDDGGEGVILRKPKSVYQYGRSGLVLKIKASRGDLEGLVVDIEGKDIYLQLPDGETMKVEEEEGMEIKRGDIVTFSFESYSRRALPTDARILRKREDISWVQVVNNYFLQSPQPHAIPDVGGVPKPFGYWNVDRHRKAEMLFLKFAQSKQFDPYVPENWYAVAKSDLYEFQDMRSMLLKYASSHIKVLQMVFPDIGLEESKFSHVTTNYWQNDDNRRKFFLKVARDSGFDPLVAKNWYSMSRAELLARKGARAVLSYYTTLREALVHLFPEMYFAENKFRTKKPANFWQSAVNVRNVLEKYAKRNGFDPTVIENWYKVDIRQDRKLRSVIIRYSNGSLRDALKSVFPQMKWDDFAFRRVSRFYWADRSKQRLYFENYARQRGLDPLSPQTWYSLSPQISSKESRTISSHYKKNIVAALISLFPDIGLVRSKFGSGLHLLWQTGRKTKN